MGLTDLTQCRSSRAGQGGLLAEMWLSESLLAPSPITLLSNFTAALLIPCSICSLSFHLVGSICDSSVAGGGRPRALRSQRCLPRDSLLLSGDSAARWGGGQLSPPLCWLNLRIIADVSCRPVGGTRPERIRKSRSPRPYGPPGETRFE